MVFEAFIAFILRLKRYGLECYYEEYRSMLLKRRIIIAPLDRLINLCVPAPSVPSKPCEEWLDQQIFRLQYDVTPGVAWRWPGPTRANRRSPCRNPKRMANM